MSEPNSASDPTPEVPKAPSFTYGSPAGEQPAPPQYGERLPAPAGPPAPAAAPAYGANYSAAPAYGPGYDAPPVKRRHTWDLVLTVILLVIGFFGMLGGVLFGASFSDPAFADIVESGFSQQGFSGDMDFTGLAPIVIISHVVLYLAALGLSIPLLVTKRVAFWAPLAAGVIAAIVLWGGYFAVIFSSVDLTQFSR